MSPGLLVAERKLIRPRRGEGLQIVRGARDVRELGRAPNGGTILSEGDHAVPHIPPSRTLDLTSPSTCKRFIRGVQRRREQLREHERYLNRMFPVLAGGAPSAAQQGAESRQGVASTPATSAAGTGGGALPFDQASKRGIEPGPTFTFTLGAGSITLGPSGLPAQGYLRMIEIDCKVKTVGTGGATEASADAPFNLFEVIRLQDTNGNQLDDLPLFALLCDNIFGGYAGSPDPRLDPFFEYNPKGEAGEKGAFSVYLVRELAPNGFGAIANMSASQAYKLTLRVSPAEGTPPNGYYKKKPATTNPEFEVSVWAHFWQLPDDMDMLKRPQTQTPPFHGTTQYRWWAPEISVTTSTNLTITQTGNEIRNIILIGRKTATPFARTFAVFPEPFQFRWDTELLLIAGQRQLRKIQRELVPDLNSAGAGSAEVSAAAEIAGVIALPFNFGEGRFVGGSGVNSWLPTVTATRLQVTGTSTEAGTISVFVNDVSVAETNPALRPVTPGPGGFVAPTAPRLQPTG